MSTLTTKSSVGQWASEVPSSARVFEDLQIDYCCGGCVSLAEACGKKNLDVTKVMDRLLVAGQSPEVHENWLKSSLTELCDHIEETHHAFLRSELPRVTALIEKVVAAHGASHTELPVVRELFVALRMELEAHMAKEEQILFPAIRSLEGATHRPEFPFETVANPIQVMEQEHDNAGTTLARIRDVTRGFLVPDGACNTYRVLLHSLRELEHDLHQHIHKENNILFPKAQGLERALATRV